MSSQNKLNDQHLKMLKDHFGDSSKSKPNKRPNQKTKNPSVSSSVLALLTLLITPLLKNIVRCMTQRRYGCDQTSLIIFGKSPVEILQAITPIALLWMIA